MPILNTIPLRIRLNPLSAHPASAIRTRGSEASIRVSFRSSEFQASVAIVRSPRTPAGSEAHGRVWGPGEVGGWGRGSSALSCLR